MSLLSLKLKVTHGVNTLLGVVRSLMGSLQARAASLVFNAFENAEGSQTILNEFKDNNLLDSASILLTPTSVSDVKIQSIKPNTAAGDFDFTRATTATRLNSSGIIESVASGLPRINFTSGTGELLLEPASTNLFSYSQDLTNSDWHHLSEVTVTASSELAPTGQLDANLVEFSGSGRSFIRQTFTVPSLATVSVFAKKGNWRYVGLRNFEDSGNPHSVFDFDTNTFVNVSSGQSASFEILNNGWYRLQVTNPSPSSNTIAGFGITDATGNVLDSTGGQVANVHLFGCQVEETSFATSYIPTSSSSATRNKDEANTSGDTSLISSTEGVLYCEFKALDDSTTGREIQISDGSTNNRVSIFLGGASNRIRTQVQVGGSEAFNKFTTTYDVKNFNKIAVRYKASNYAFYINGAVIGQSLTQTSIFSADTLDQLNFKRMGASNVFEGRVKTVAVFKEALTDAQLISLTS